jgi:hypothetical protein
MFSVIIGVVASFFFPHSKESAIDVARADVSPFPTDPPCPDSPSPCCDGL